MSTKTAARTATHRPATRKRIFRFDDLFAVDLFSGFGGLTEGIRRAGFTTIMAANHDTYKVEIHEANHPDAEHWIADLVDPDSSDYHSALDLPAADLLVAGVSCKNHTQANSKKAYEQGIGLWQLDDPEYDAQITRSERDRATATCVLQYAGKHRPRMMLIECTTELQCWGPAVPGKRYGDTTTFWWWLGQAEKLGYRYKILYLNSMFFGVGQSRDRLYIVFWLAEIPAPDLDHRPETWCGRCDRVVEAVWTWKTGIPPTGSVRYGKQYHYTCPSCRRVVVPPFTPALDALDLSDLGPKIGDKPLKKFTDKQTGETVMLPMAPATMARAERCRQRFAEFPAVLMPITRRGEASTGRHPWHPMGTQTAQQETALLSTAAIMQAAGNTYERPGSNCRSRGVDEPLWSQTTTNGTGVITPPVAVAIDNFQGAPRSAADPLPTQVGGETMAVLSSGVLPFRRNTVPTTHAEPQPTITSEQIPGLLTAAGTIKHNGSIAEAKYRAHSVSDPFGAVVGSANTQGVLFSGWYKQNGSTGAETAPHPVSDALGTLTSRDTTALLTAQWHETLRDLPLADCHFRMNKAYEIGRACGFDVDHGTHRGTFKVWGSNSDQVDGYGNAVTPHVGHWLGDRLRRAFHGEAA